MEEIQYFRQYKLVMCYRYDIMHITITAHQFITIHHTIIWPTQSTEFTKITTQLLPVATHCIAIKFLLKYMKIYVKSCCGI